MAACLERLASASGCSTSSAHRPLAMAPSAHRPSAVRQRSVVLHSLSPARGQPGGPLRSMPIPAAADEAGSGFKNGEIIACKPCIDAGLTEGVIREEDIKTKFIAETMLPTKFGKFRLRGYKHSIDGGITFTEPAAIICGAVENMENVPVRVHDACFTSEVLGSLKCDCADQLALAMQMIHEQPPGMLIYLQQEGRGIGLANKIAAYSLQEQGLDTVDANRALGLPDDCREYTSVRNILRDLGIKSIRLITNNPRKMSVLTTLGITVNGRLPCIVEGGEYSKGYLATKQSRMDHMLPSDKDGWAQALDGSWCYWNHDGEPGEPVPVALSAGGMDLPNGAVVSETGKVIVDSVRIKRE